MPNRKSFWLNVLIIIAFPALIPCLILAAEESITLTTYYPSPYGVYSEMRLYPKASAICNDQQEGLMYYDNDPPNERGLRVCMCKNPPVCDAFEWMPASGYWAASLSNPDNIYNTNPGNVGIGTTDPLGLKLFVMANTGIRNGMQIADPQGHYVSMGGGIDAINHNSAGLHIGTVGGLTLGGIGGGLVYDYTVNDISVFSTYNITIASNAASSPLGVGDIKFLTGGVERMRIMNSGNVGIGTTNPQASLDIISSVGRVFMRGKDGVGMFWINRGPDEGGVPLTNPEGDNIIGWNDATGFSGRTIHLAGTTYIGSESPAWAKQSLSVSGNVHIGALSGSGNAYVCVDSSGNLYRSGSPCI